MFYLSLLVGWNCRKVFAYGGWKWAFGRMELHLVGWSRLYIVSPDQKIFSISCIWWLELAFGLMELRLLGWNRPFIVTPDQMQLSQCFANMVVGIGIWLDGIALG
jgi:hypothetical protein